VVGLVVLAVGGVGVVVASADFVVDGGEVRVEGRGTSVGEQGQWSVISEQ